MGSTAALILIGSLQTTFMLLVILLVLTHRRRSDRTDRERRQYSRQLEEPLRAWAVGGTSIESLLPLFRVVPPELALESIAVHCAVRATPNERASMARLLRAEVWMQQLIDGYGARRWAVRLQAARAIAICGLTSDRPLLAQLLRDPHTAVVSAVLATFGRMADAALVAQLLELLPDMPEYLQRRSAEALHDAADVALPALRERVRDESDSKRLQVYLRIAAALADPRTIIVCAEHASHADSCIRALVARACQHYFSERAHPVLEKLLADDSAAVRAEAARAIGEIRASLLVPALAARLRDRAHGVRLAAALALASLGDAGRSALATAAASDDRFASDTARLVARMSRGAVRELVEI